jgi:hypothetical protein
MESTNKAAAKAFFAADERRSTLIKPELHYSIDSAVARIHPNPLFPVSP